MRTISKISMLEELKDDLIIFINEKRYLSFRDFFHYLYRIYKRQRFLWDIKVSERQVARGEVYELTLDELRRLID